MIDNFTVLTVTLVIVFVVFRAATLDRILPWFGTDEASSKSPGRKPAAVPTWRERAAAANQARRPPPGGNPGASPPRSSGYRPPGQRRD